MLLAVAVSYGVARTVTRPLARDHRSHAPDRGDRRSDAQDSHLSDSRGWHDEDARLLATTFNTLTDSIARFQREAAQRERLSSLGRMSTVVAHEIRNPLMIIKGALRQLTRDGATAADVRDAAADIDGEIDRLNRVVNEVLDFARPIRFDRAPTDINALCRDAVCAVAAAPTESAPVVATELDPAVPTLDTDGERLRTVLVNLLDQRPPGRRRADVAARRKRCRRDAVHLAPHRSPRRHLDSRYAASASPPDDLPRIFDPYFTTRRAGTGLGLPIAKNIIDGLGGSITVASTAGAGTEHPHRDRRRSPRVQRR